VFVLVHGAWHGAWCWEDTVAVLADRGHEAVAVDLPCDDVDAGLAATADVIAAAAPDADDVVLVAHSLGGLPASLVAARRPLRALIYLAAFIPQPGKSMAEQFATSPEPILLFDRAGLASDERGRSYWTDASAMYADVPPDVARAAAARLRPQAPASQREPHPAGPPGIPTTSIVCSHDLITNPAWSRRVTRERLHVEPVELATGHFPMLTHPELLAGALLSAA